MNCGSVGCCLAMCRDCSRRKPPPPQPGCRRTPLEPPSRAELQALGLGSVCPPPPPPRFGVPTERGGLYTCCWQQGVGGKVKLPSLRGTCVLGGNVSGKTAALCARARGKKKTHKNPNNSPWICVPSWGWQQHPTWGCRAAGCWFSHPLLQRWLAPGQSQRGHWHVTARLCSNQFGANFSPFWDGAGTCAGKVGPGEPWGENMKLPGSHGRGGAGGCAAPPRAGDQGTAELLRWGRGPVSPLAARC